MAESVKTDQEIFEKLAAIHEGDENGKKNEKISGGGKIGDDFISFDSSEEEVGGEEETALESIEETPDSTGAPNGNTKRKGSDSINGERPINLKNSKLALSPETKKKLGKLFHPKAPWFPDQLRAGSRDLAEHYGFLTAPFAKRRHYSTCSFFRERHE